MSDTYLINNYSHSTLYHNQMLTCPRTLGARCPRLHQRAGRYGKRSDILKNSTYGAQMYEKSVRQATVSSAGNDHGDSSLA